MTPDDPRHGTPAGYQAGCGDSCCRTAAAEYRRNLVARHYLTGYQRIDATGTRRRVEALVALGYTWETLDDYLGRQHGTMSRRHHQWVVRGARVYREGAAEIAAMYDALSMKVPPDTYGSKRAKARARRAGWLPPLAWDDDHIDDPTYQPNTRAILRRDRTPTARASRRTEIVTSKDIDEAVVSRVLDGEILRTTKAEKHEIMRRWLASGGSEASLCKRMGWKPGRYVVGISHSEDDRSTDRKAS